MSMSLMSWSDEVPRSTRPPRYIYESTNAQYTPPTPTRRNCRVASRRRCVHEFATSSRRLPTDSVMLNAAVGRDQVYNTAVNGRPIEVGYDVTYDAARSNQLYSVIFVNFYNFFNNE